jgi:RNA polymerase sigma factor (sigma-70 family)
MTDSAATPPSGRSTGWSARGSDERLVKRAKKGDRRAIEAIYERYHQDLYRFCLMLVGNRHDAEDALQGTMVKLIRSLPGEQRSIQLRPWIYRIARNESIDTIRRRRVMTPIGPEEVSSEPQVAETVEVREHLRGLVEDVGELPERQRAALVMRELGDLGFAEIGSALGMSDAAARQAVYEARVNLRHMEMGREMRCEQVVWELSEADGRVRNRREIQAHIRACDECRAFRDSISRRSGEFKALAPLPVVASAALLQGAFGASSGAVGGGAASAAGAGAGKALIGSGVVKVAATCAVVAAIGTTAADRGGLIDVPIGGDRGPARESSPTPRQHAREAVGAARTTRGGGPGEVKRSATAARSVQRQVVDDRTAGGGPSATTGDGSPSASTPPSQATGQGNGAGTTKAQKNASRKGQGKAAGLPPSSAHGQQTAAGHKSPHANASPGTPRGVGHDHQSSPPSHPPPVNEKPEREPPAAEPSPERSPPEKEDQSAEGSGQAKGEANLPVRP